MMEIKDIVVTACAILGALLGVFNFVRSYLSDAERVRVAIQSGGQDEYPAVEVVNFSPFGISVVDVGRVYPDGQVSRVQIRIINVNADGLPRRIEARSSHEFRVTLHETIAENVHRSKYTYVRTALGSVFTSEPKLVRWKRRAMEKLRMRERDL